jgi:hypothetical protein
VFYEDVMGSTMGMGSKEVCMFAMVAILFSL